MADHPARLAAIDQQYARDAATLARLVAVATAATRPNTLPASATAAVYDDLIDAMSPALVRRLLAVAVVELATRAATPVGPASQPASGPTPRASGSGGGQAEGLTSAEPGVVTCHRHRAAPPGHRRGQPPARRGPALRCGQVPVRTLESIGAPWRISRLHRRSGSLTATVTCPLVALRDGPPRADRSARAGRAGGWRSWATRARPRVRASVGEPGGVVQDPATSG